MMTNQCASHYLYSLGTSYDFCRVDLSSETIRAITFTGPAAAGSVLIVGAARDSISRCCARPAVGRGGSDAA